MSDTKKDRIFNHRQGNLEEMIFRLETERDILLEAAKYAAYAFTEGDQYTQRDATNFLVAAVAKVGGK